MRSNATQTGLLSWLILAIAVVAFACNPFARDERPTAEEAVPLEDEEYADSDAEEWYLRDDDESLTAEIGEPDELSAREAELAQREAELAQREALMAQRQAQPPAQPAPAPAPRDETWREREPAPAPTPPAPTTFTVPAGTAMAAELSTGLSSESSQVGQRFSARLSSPLNAGGQTAVPSGATVEGRVVEAQALRKIGGQAKLGLVFDRMVLADGSSVPISARFYAEGRSETKRDAATIGGSAAAGAILGRVIGGGSKSRRTAAGAAVGAAVGSAVAARSEGETIELPAGTVLEVTLDSPVTVTG